MIDRRIVKYEAMWATEVRRYALIELDSTRPDACLVMDLETGGLLAMDDADDVVAAVISLMRSAGARLMTPDEATTSARNAWPLPRA
jgi:hypothetical protein